MTQVETAASGPAQVTDGIADWLQLVERTLQGLNHALNNRIGSLAALVELYHLGDLEGDPSEFQTLETELRRLSECNHVVRLLRRDSGVGEEALLMSDVLSDALAVQRFATDGRAATVAVTPAPHAEPVRTERWALLRVLVLLLDEIVRMATGIGSSVEVATTSDEERLTLVFRVRRLGDELPEASAAPYARLLAQSLGSSVSADAGALTLCVPTLKARRASGLPLR